MLTRLFESDRLGLTDSQSGQSALTGNPSAFSGAARTWSPSPNCPRREGPGAGGEGEGLEGAGVGVDEPEVGDGVAAVEVALVGQVEAAGAGGEDAQTQSGARSKAGVSGRTGMMTAWARRGRGRGRRGRGEARGHRSCRRRRCPTGGELAGHAEGGAGMARRRGMGGGAGGRRRSRRPCRGARRGCPGRSRGARGGAGCSWGRRIARPERRCHRDVGPPGSGFLPDFRPQIRPRCPPGAGDRASRAGAA